MRRLLIPALTVATLLTGTAALAQPPAGGPPPPGRGERFFDEMDTNKDGVVTRAEVNAVLEKRFAALDTNKDGKISDTERQAERDAHRAERFAALDTDKNGQLSQQEFDAARKGGPDGGKPGFRGGKGPGGGEGRKFGGRGGRDRAPKGDVTKADFMAHALTRFDLLDSNDDGKITAEERDAAMARFNRGPRPDQPKS